MDCSGCGDSLLRSVYRDDGRLKSCPRCSTRARRHVFRPLDDLGERHPHGGEAIIQSWCRDCRGQRPARPSASVRAAAPASLPAAPQDHSSESRAG